MSQLIYYYSLLLANLYNFNDFKNILIDYFGIKIIGFWLLLPKKFSQYNKKEKLYIYTF